MIFISYANEDHSYACKLYIELKKSALDPWMDKPPAPYQNDGLKIGQNWQKVLDEKLRGANHILLVLSPISVKKRGYVQVEFRTALNLMNMIAEGQVFVLPVLASTCDVPALGVGQIQLRDLHWAVVEEAMIPAFAAQLAADLMVA